MTEPVPAYLAGTGTPYRVFSPDLIAEVRKKPSASVRITTTVHARRPVLWPALPDWLSHYPDVEVDLSVASHFADVIVGMRRPQHARPA